MVPCRRYERVELEEYEKMKAQAVGAQAVAAELARLKAELARLAQACDGEKKKQASRGPFCFQHYKGTLSLPF